MNQLASMASDNKIRTTTKKKSLKTIEFNACMRTNLIYLDTSSHGFLNLVKLNIFPSTWSKIKIEKKIRFAYAPYTQCYKVAIKIIAYQSSHYKEHGSC